MNETQKPWINPTPKKCGICQGDKIPLIRSGVRICGGCDGWPPILEPPKA